MDGLLHISDLSWGRISHPSEVVGLDEEIECIVIGFDRDEEKISLGLKQKTNSPWEIVEERYPIGAKVKGKVVNVMNYGVFVRLEDGIEGLVSVIGGKATTLRAMAEKTADLICKKTGRNIACMTENKKLLHYGRYYK